MWEIIKSIILGIVEGVTEWLPVSSTGHMILVDSFLHLNVDSDPAANEKFKEMFLVVIQLGAILAVVLLFWHKIWPFGKKNNRVPLSKTGFGAYLKMDIVRMWCKVIVACVPAAIVGLLFDEKIDELFYNHWVVSITLIVFGDYKMTSTLVEGRFPNYNSVIPQNNPKKIIIEKKELYNSLRRVSVMANQASNLVKFDVAEGKIVISAQDMDYSMSGHETLTCQYEGENIAIGFKSPFVLEILSNIESENVVLELSDPTRPGLFLPFENEDNDEDLLMLLMPMMV